MKTAHGDGGVDITHVVERSGQNAVPSPGQSIDVVRPAVDVGVAVLIQKTGRGHVLNCLVMDRTPIHYVPSFAIRILKTLGVEATVGLPLRSLSNTTETI